MDDRRDEFLLEMYRQMLNDINRHILVVWQSVGVLVGAVAFLSLAEKGVVSLDIAVAVVIIMCAWLYAHLADAAYWYNRNLVIVANIERQFLLQSDLRDIHSYFGKHRKNNKPIAHLRIQRDLALALGLTLILWHAIQRVLPGLGAPISNFDPLRALPYLVAGGAAFYGVYWDRSGSRKYASFLKDSPGKEIDASEISYEAGHAQK